jgi:hypothetical protein
LPRAQAGMPGRTTPPVVNFLKTKGRKQPSIPSTQHKVKTMFKIFVYRLATRIAAARQRKYQKVMTAAIDSLSLKEVIFERAAMRLENEKSVDALENFFAAEWQLVDAEERFAKVLAAALGPISGSESPEANREPDGRAKDLIGQLIMACNLH